jgi:multidrug efflux pump subunit AcrA (membrane-fusion protein)
VINVPNAALRFRPADAPQQPRTGPTVWKIEGKQLTPAPVKLGITDGVVSEIVSGNLQKGDKVAIPTIAANTTAQQPATRNPMMPMGGGRRR